MKKILSILLACMILSFSFAGATFAEETATATIAVLEDAFVRAIAKHSAVNFATDETLRVANGDTSYLKFQVKDLRTAMSDKEARYILSLTTFRNTSGDGAVDVYGISGDNRTGWTETALMYNNVDDSSNSASVNGMNADVSNKLGTMNVSGFDTTFTVDVTDYIETVPEDGIATIKLQNPTQSRAILLFHSNNSTSATTSQKPTLTATRTYREGTDAVFDGIEIPGIVSENIVLPTNGDIYGSTISWSSSDPDVITADGVVTRGEKSVKVTLTAAYDGYSDIQKSFDVIVPEEGALLSDTTAVSEDALVRAGKGSTLYGTATQMWVSVEDSSYLKFDVKSLRDAMNDKDAVYTLSLTSKSDSSIGDVNVYGISGTNRTEWSESTLTYNMTHETIGNGMDTDVSNLLGTISVTGPDAVFSVDITDYVNSLPEDGIATIKLQNKGLTTEVIRFYTKESGNSKEATLTATRTFKEVTADVFDGIEIPSVVTESLTLPTLSLNDSPITWSSSHPDVIAADGTVTRQSSEAVVTLTASGDGKTKSFDVIVPKAGETGTASVTAKEDAFTRTGTRRGTYYGADPSLRVWNNENSYLKFDVKELRAAMNGKDAKFVLSLTTLDGNTGAGAVNVYGISGDNRSTELEDGMFCYNTAAANGMDNDVSTLLGTMNVSGTNTTFTVDVTEYIEAVPENGIALLKLQNTALADLIMFNSGNNTTGSVPTLTATRTYTDDYSDSINPKLYVNGKAVTELSEGRATARVAFTGSGVTDAAKGTLIIALYNGDTLKSVKSVSADFSDELINDMSVSIDVPSGAGYSVKAFLLNGFDTLVPLTGWEELR